jgi:hypothetical protein
MARRTRQLAAALLGSFLILPPASGAARDAKRPNEFSDVKLLVKTGDKIKETDVVIIFQASRLVIRSQELGVNMKLFPYSEMISADYSYSTHPLWRSGSGASGVINVLALPVFWMKGKKHWLSIKTAGDFGVLRLDKDNRGPIITAFEKHTKKKVHDLGEEK